MDQSGSFRAWLPEIFFASMLAMALIFFLAQSPPGSENHSGLPPLVLEGQTMGTRYHLLLDPAQLADESPLNTGLAESIQTMLDHLDRDIFSTYRDTSQLSQFNALPPGEQFPVAPAMTQVLQSAQWIHQQSAGAFDVSLKALVDLWGFGSNGPPAAIPDSNAIAVAQQSTGMEKLYLPPEGGWVSKSAALHLDLSAIAKGYALDSVGQLLAAQDIDNFLLEIGGEVLARGVRPDGSPWRIGIEKPQEGASTLFQPLLMAGDPLAVATSGSYRNGFIKNGKRYSHSLDPRTGWPVSHGLVSVTVIADSVMEADAWATALMVLGPEEGMKIANHLQLAAYFIVTENTNGTDSHYSSMFTPEFTQYLGKPESEVDG